MMGSGVHDTDEDIGKLYKSVLYQRGFGYDQELDYHNTYGLGFSDALQGFIRMVTPFFKSGLKYLGTQAVNTAANIAQDVISGANVKEAAKAHVSQTAEDIFAKAPKAIANVIKTTKAKRGTVSQEPSFDEETPTRAIKRRRYSQDNRRTLLRAYPALGKISKK